MSIKNMVSVIIPMYNRQEYIEECISSVLSQTYKSLEIILIDDGSTDRTVEICNELKDKFSNIRLALINHAGVSAARNKGIDLSRGKYLFFLDSDDIIHPRLIETLVTGLVQENADIGGTLVENISEDVWHTVYDKINEDAGPGEITYQDRNETLDKVLLGYSPLSCIGGVLVRRDWVGETRFRTELFYGEDFYFNYENVIKGASTVFLKQKWYYCRHHKTNSSFEYSYNNFTNYLLLRELVWRNEEALNRKKYADCQKNHIFPEYLKVMKKKNITKDEAKKIQKIMKSYAKTLFGAMKFPSKLCYILTVFIPFGLCVYFAFSKAFKIH